MSERRYTDEVLDARFQDQQRQLDSLRNTIEALAKLPTEMARQVTRLNGAVDDLDDFKEWIGDVERRFEHKLDDALAELGVEARERRRNRVAVAVALLAGIFGLIAALVAALATVLTT